MVFLILRQTSWSVEFKSDATKEDMTAFFEKFNLKPAVFYNSTRIETQDEELIEAIRKQTTVVDKVVFMDRVTAAAR